MADLVDRVISYFEVRGLPAANAGYKQLADQVSVVTQRLKVAKKAAEDFTDAQLRGPKQRTTTTASGLADWVAPNNLMIAHTDSVVKPKLGGIFGALATGWSRVMTPMTASFTVATLLADAVSKGIYSVINLGKHAWNVANAFEEAKKRVTGLTLGLVDFGKGSDPAENLIKSQRAANILMKEFRDTALSIGSPIAEIERAFTAVNPVLSAVGKSQLDVLNVTNASARAAKVYGESAAAAGQIAAKAIAEGSVEGDSPLARALKAQTQVTSKMAPEERFKRVTSVLERMGGPLDKINRTSAVAFSKWQEFGDYVLRQLVEPVFTRIGNIANSIVDAVLENQGPIDEIVGDMRNWLNVALDVLGVTYDIGAGILKWIWGFGRFGPMLDTVWKTLGFVFNAVDIAASGINGLIEMINGDSNSKGGMARLLAISTSIEIKWRELVLSGAKIVHAFENIFVSDSNLKALGMDWDGWERGYKEKTDSMGRLLRGYEKTAGMGAISETSRRLKELEEGAGKSKLEAYGFLAGLKGLKVQQHNTITLQQDFRDQDPDAVWVTFARGLERLGQASVQSNVAGVATAFDAGM